MKKRLAKKIVKGRYLPCNYKGRIPYWLDKWDERYTNIHFGLGYDKRLEEAFKRADEFSFSTKKVETKYRVKHILWKQRIKN